jgi:threonine synthase
MGDDEVTPTLAPAMDVTVPSNLERFTGDPAKAFQAGFATDDEIVETIATVDEEHGYLLDPHTATAWRVGEAFIGDRPQVVVGTAHPAKFADAVQRAVGRAPETPEGFEELTDRPERVVVIDPDPSELDRLLR